MCSVSKFLVERFPSGISTQASTPLETVDKERLAWQALASCLVTEHTTGHLNSMQYIQNTDKRTFLGHLYRDDLIKPDQMSVRPSTIFLSDLDETSYVGRGR